MELPKKDSVELVQEDMGRLNAELDSGIDKPDALSQPWTASDERRATLRADLRILPIIMLGFFSMQVDRANISSALTSGMTTDLHITQEVVNNGQTILYMFTLAGELPCNLILQRIGAKWWLPAQMTAWGFVATMQLFAINKASYYAFRAMLGLTESGFIAGCVYYLSTIYTRRQLATRASLFWVGSYIGKGSGGLMAAGIFTLGSKSSLKAWQWLFLIEGVVTIFIGLIALTFLPRSILDPRTLVPGLKILNERDSQILHARLISDDATKSQKYRMKITTKQILAAFASWPFYPLLFFIIALIGPVSGLETYNNQIITSFGFSKVRGNALSSFGYWVQIPIIYLGGLIAAKFRMHGAVIIATTLMYLILTCVFYHIEQSAVSVWAKWISFQLTIMFNGVSYIVAVAWVTVNAHEPTKRSVHSALALVATNVAQSYGSQMFHAADAPFYIGALRACIALQSTAVVLACIALGIYWYCNKKLIGDASKAVAIVNAEEQLQSQGQEGVSVSPTFRYTL